MAKTEWSKIMSPRFVTLTYQEGWRGSDFDFKKHKHHFAVSIRRAIPGLEFMWRAEFQKRGAPHLHMIVSLPVHYWDSENSELQGIFTEVWQSVTGERSEAHSKYGVQVKNLSSYRGAMAYLRKYLGKVSVGEFDVSLGRMWGTTAGWPTEPIGEASFDPHQFHRLKRIARGILRARNRRSKYYKRAFAANHSIRLACTEETSRRLFLMFSTQPPRVPTGPSPAPPEPVRARPPVPDPELFGQEVFQRMANNYHA